MVYMRVIGPSRCPIVQALSLLLCVADAHKFCKNKNTRPAHTKTTGFISLINEGMAELCLERTVGNNDSARECASVSASS